MMTAKIFGYIVLSSENSEAAPLFEKLVKNGARIFDVRRASGRAVFSISLFEYIKNRKALSLCETVRVCGLAWALNKLWERRSAFIALAVASAAIIYAGGYCSKIEISGLETTNEFELRNYIKAYGAETGRLKNDIDVDRLCRAIKSKYGAAYAGARFNGSVLEITIKEGIRTPELQDEAKCDIVAKYRGVITEITPLRGEAMVKAGDVVNVGDVLIAGKYTKREFEHELSARGTVVAAVDYFGSSEVEGEYNRSRTGRAGTEQWLKLNRLYFKISGNNTFDSYDTEMTSLGRIGENSALPLELLRIRRYETVTGKANEAGKIAAREKAFKNALTKAEDYLQILDFSSTIDERSGGLCSEAVVTVLKDIGAKRYYSED